MSIKELVELSRFYGSNPEYTLAGGGNTSFKDEKDLIVKASGFSLADATAASFVKMDRQALSAIWEKTYPSSSDEREKNVLADLMAARKEGEKRPSVEALLHDIIPCSYVVHLHPALVNGLCCSKNGKTVFKEIFSDDSALWVPSTNPGYILSRLVKTALTEYYTERKKHASVIFLQNHGIFAGADTADGIKRVYNEIMEKIGARIKRSPDFSDEERITHTEDFPQRHRTNGSKDIEENLLTQEQIQSCKEIMKMLKDFNGFSAFMNSRETARYIKDRHSFYPVSSAFTPDHIVYAGSDPLFTEANTKEAVRAELESHNKKTGRAAKIIAVKNLGVFSAAAAEKAACFALDLFKDTVKVAVYTESFGGPLFMTREKIDFINNWEVERFRSSVSTN